MKIHFQRDLLPYNRGTRLPPQFHCREVGENFVSSDLARGKRKKTKQKSLLQRLPLTSQKYNEKGKQTIQAVFLSTSLNFSQVIL
jgi:hypothetical protein